MEAVWSARRVARQLNRSGCVVKKVLGPVDPRDVIYTKTRLRMPSTDQSSRRPPHSEGHLGSRHPLRVLPLTPTQGLLRLEWCPARGNWTAAEWYRVVFSDESIFNLGSDDNRVCVWRPHGERFSHVFDLQKHTALTAGVMVWGAFAYNTLSPLVLVRDTMAA
ncbi:transposable element Tcb1 transposase [Trichonephila clavipes]|nr:transposable element Tcb1 transposase [Trichonephila clavipes]